MHVGPEIVAVPRRWGLGFIRRLMLTFGVLSSVFDYLTFVVFLLILRAGPEEFRTGWFMESVISACLVVLVVRTRRPFFRTLPGRQLPTVTHGVAAIVVAFPFPPLAKVFGFTPIPWQFLPALAGIVAAYIAPAEITKRWFFRREDRRLGVSGMSAPRSPEPFVHTPQL